MWGVLAATMSLLSGAVLTLAQRPRLRERLAAEVELREKLVAAGQSVDALDALIAEGVTKYVATERHA